MSLVLNVEILGEFKKLTSATTGAQSELQGLNNKISGFASSAKRMFATIGLGLSFAVITRQLEEATKAAIDDRKSQELLANAMQNTGLATDATIASAEKYIAKMQRSAAVADDDLRPAYQKLFIATGDVEQSNRLLQIALDASAGSGKGLDVVSQAMAKSLAGNDAALVKLIPSLKGSKTPIDDLAAAFAGSAEKAANLDPYQRMQVMFSDIQEQVGTAMLPILDKLSTWLASPKGEETIQKVVDVIQKMLGWLTATVEWVAANGDWLAPLTTGILTVVGAWKAVTLAVNATKAAIGLATAAQVAFNAISGGTGGVSIPKTKVPTGSTGNILKNLGPWASLAGPIAAELLLVGSIPGSTQQTSGGGVKLGTPITVPNSPAIVNNVTVNNNQGTVTGSDITNLLKQFSNATGTN
jgi:hypothetical protein